MRAPSPLKKRNIMVDKNLAPFVNQIVMPDLGCGEGDLISCTELVKGIFSYVKLMNLKQEPPLQAVPPTSDGSATRMARTLGASA